MRDGLVPGEKSDETQEAITALGIAPATARVQLHRWWKPILSEMRDRLAA